LSIAARLQQLGIDTLIVDRHPRVGDNWRTRYHSLTLHNEVYVNHLPYLHFPPTFPVYIPKDKLANWFESYVEAMELNFWTGTALAGGSYDGRAGQWSLRLRTAGGERVMHSRHLIFATGVSSIPYTPALPGLDQFRGMKVHSGDFKDAAQWKGRNALVLGTGTSGHDVAQELHAHGAQVTMIQRSKTHVVSLKEAQSVYAIYSEGIPFDDCDLLATSFPYPVLRRSYQVSTAKGVEVDKALLAALRKRGFRIWEGEDDTGFQMMYLRRGGGYYFNVGCSELIISGAVGLLQFADADSFVPEGLRLRDGRVVPADLLVLATGYRNQQEAVRLYLGDAMAERVGPVWGYDEGGELRNMWRRTAQPGLWFTAGSLAQCRIFSRYLALQIKALEAGLLE
ncbi:MAG TPA: NAD(P)/FAD-dependent oxidoreductase, partial [Pseudolabrys sp.]|nr:NAD(P)/FAD-dependent oxidoreductase [Pseudolabrys sp.]